MNTVMYRAEREIRQEQNRPKALSLRKCCFYFLREECAGGKRKARHEYQFGSVGWKGMSSEGWDSIFSKETDSWV